jgi:hypothetical protein
MNNETYIKPAGRFDVEHWRRGKLLTIHHAPNGVSNEGKTGILNANFYNGTNIGYWWVGLIDNTGFVALASTDSYQSINQPGNGWSEFTGYVDGINTSTRPTWNNNAASAQTITNTVKTLFTITVAGTVVGAFVVGGPTSQIKGDYSSGNVLWADALFPVTDVLPTDQLKITYTILL